MAKVAWQLLQIVKVAEQLVGEANDELNRVPSIGT